MPTKGERNSARRIASAERRELRRTFGSRQTEAAGNRMAVAVASGEYVEPKAAYVIAVEAAWLKATAGQTKRERREGRAELRALGVE